MTSRRLHAMLVAFPAIALATGAVILGALLFESIRAERAMARTVLIGLFTWPMAVAAVSFLGRAVRAVRDSGRPDPVRTLGIVPVGGAWRIPVRRRHPVSTACLAVGAAGGLMAALTALGVLETPALWHVALSVGGSLLIGLGSLAVASALDRDGRASMVLDPGARVLIVPRTRERAHVVRISLDSVRSVTTQSYGAMGLLNRVVIDFDDEMLGQGVQITLLGGVDPGRAMDLVAWVRGFAAAPRVQSVPPVARAHTAPAPVAHAHPSIAPMASAPPPPAAHASPAPAMHGAPSAPPPARHAPPMMNRAARPRPARRGSLASLVGRVNMPAALSGLGLACVLGFVAMGLQIQPRQIVASDTAAVPTVTRMNTIGTTSDGTVVHIDDLESEWVWTIDVGPASGVCDQQMSVLDALRRRFDGSVRFRVVLVSGERGGERPDARLANRYAGRFGLPISSVLIRHDPTAPVPRHRMISADGRIVHEATGFMSAGSIEQQIGLRQAAARMEDRP